MRSHWLAHSSSQVVILRRQHICFWRHPGVGIPSHEWDAVSWPQLNASGTGNPARVRTSSCSQKPLQGMRKQFENVTDRLANCHMRVQEKAGCWRLVAQDWLTGIYARSPVRIWKGLIGFFPFSFCVQPNTEIQVGTIKRDASVSLGSLLLSKIPHLYIP